MDLHLLSQYFHDLGSSYYDTFNREHKIRNCLKRLQSLGWQSDTGTLFCSFTGWVL